MGPAAGGTASGALLLPLLLSPGCSTILAVREQQGEARRTRRDRRHGSAPRAATRGGPLIVGTLANGDRAVSASSIISSPRSPAPGSSPPRRAPTGRRVRGHQLDGRYDGEPAYRPSPDHPVTLGPGRAPAWTSPSPATASSRAWAFAIADLEARAQKEQQVHSLYGLSVSGTGDHAGRPPLRREDRQQRACGSPGTSCSTRSPGSTSSSPTTPRRIPVLFVHGIGGTPLDFRELIAVARPQALPGLGGLLPVRRQPRGHSATGWRRCSRAFARGIDSRGPPWWRTAWAGLVTRRFLLGDFDRRAATWCALRDDLVAARRDEFRGQGRG